MGKLDPIMKIPCLAQFIIVSIVNKINAELLKNSLKILSIVMIVMRSMISLTLEMCLAMSRKMQRQNVNESINKTFHNPSQEK